MQDDDPEKPLLALSRVPRVIPRADFVRRLSSEIGRAARERTGYRAGQPFASQVVELRKLVRLLRQTLVPVQPRLAYKTALSEQLRLDATRTEAGRHPQWRWLVIGSAVGSLFSLLGVLILSGLAAMLLRQRQVRLRTDKKGARA